MKYINLAAFAACFFINQTMGQATPTLAFNVSPKGVACGHGTDISCQPAPTHSCKGNFDPAQVAITVVQLVSGCHISLYPDENQQGGVVERVDTSSPASCASASSATWKSYGVYCDLP